MTHVLTPPPAAAPPAGRDTGPTADWRDVVVSFLPRRLHAAGVRWVGAFPLLLVLAVQAGLTLRLSSSAFRDEALYLWTGHRVFQFWFDGATLYDDPSSYFSGSPFVYPPLAALIDNAFGLAGARGFSLLCMLAATTALYSATRRLFGSRAAFVAALAFALAGSVHHLGHFATFDALSLSLVAGGMALGLRAVDRGRSGPAIAGGALFALAVAVKYAALMFVPIALLVILLAPLAAVSFRRQARTAAISAGVFLAVLISWAATIGRNDVAGFLSTTLNRSGSAIVDRASFGGVVVRGLGFAGPWYALIAVGFVMVTAAVRRGRPPTADGMRQILVAALLVAGAVLPVAYQAYIGEAASLDKHVAFGLVFGAPLIGAIVRAHGRPLVSLVMVMVLTVLGIFGVATSTRIVSAWSNTTALTDVLAYKFAAAPYIRTLGEPVEPIRYAFEDSTEYWQWDTTDPIQALYYKAPDGRELRGVDAAKAGLADDYWQVVYFNGSTGASQELEPLLPGFGYELTDTVTLQNGNGPDEYRIWQRFE